MKPINTDKALIEALDALLTKHPTGLREIELIDLLDRDYPNLFPKPDLSDQLFLFQHHFMLRHSLYVLQNLLSDAGQYSLTITPVIITKQRSVQTASGLPEEFDGVRDYYLDLSNLNKESHETVEKMLQDFWLALAKYEHQPEALAVLGLNGDESNQEKKQRYKKLVQLHHPDKGGDAETFQKIQQAWESLKGTS